jgi:deoxyuridine 5'-triphosphate nucleotidohydrolase
MKIIIYKILEWLGFVDIVYYKGKKPYKRYSGDAGFDLYVSETTKIMPKSVANIKVHTVVTIKNCWLLLVGRSSTFHKKKLQVMTGIIDNGYTGYLHTCIYNPNDYICKILKDERVSQVIPFKKIKTVLVEGTKKLNTKERCSKGFGSTGY